MTSNPVEAARREAPKPAWEDYRDMGLVLFRDAEEWDQRDEPDLAAALHKAAEGLQWAADYLFDAVQAPQPQHSYVDDYHV